MTINSEDVATLRTFLEEGNTERFRRELDQTGNRGTTRQWNVLVTAALTKLVNMRFGAQRRGDEIVRWVGKARTRPGFAPEELDPVIAEGLIRGLLGEVSSAEAVADRLDSKFQATLLLALFEDARSEGLTIDDLLAQTKDHAQQILSGMG